MATKRNATASRGFVNNTILECLFDGDKYGYDIIKQVKDKSNGKIVLKEPSLYSSLKRFEQKGYISSYWGNSAIGGRRHYYSLTEVGKNYYNSLHLPKSDKTTLINTEDNSELNSQVSLDLDNDLYNLDEDNTETNDDYINHVSFNVEDKMNELLSSTETNLKQSNIINENNLTKEVTNINNSINEIIDVENENDDVSDNSKKAEEDETLIEVVYEQINNGVEDNKSTSSKESEISSDLSNQNKTEQTENNSIDNYTLEHKFRKDNIKEFVSGSEEYVQYDLFKEPVKESYIDSPTLQSSTKNLENKDEIVPNQSSTEINKEIPLIKEADVDFFNWNELKRKAVNNKNSYSVSNVKTSNFSITKSKNLFKNNINVKNDTKSSNIENHDHIAPNKVDSRIFDNVKERIELKDAVIAPKKIQPKYKDEPTLSEEEIELLNKKFQEKFEYVAQTKTYQKEKEPDYKKILGELYHDDSVQITNNENDLYDENRDDYNIDEETQEYVDKYSYEDVSNISDEQVISAINKSRTYNYNNLQKNLNEEGFKFKPYSTEKTLQTEQYIRINRVKLFYAIFMFIFILVQTGVLFFVLNGKDLINIYDYPLYILASLAGVGVFIFFLIQYMIHKDERKMKYYNLSFHIMFGILYLFIGLILTYAINLILGLNNANTLLFISRLLLPAILLTNFVFAPIVYKVIIDNTKK